MIRFKQQAYYIDEPGVFFVDRHNYFNDRESAFSNLERFACVTKNRIPNRQYNIVVTRVDKTEPTDVSINSMLADKLI